MSNSLRFIGLALTAWVGLRALSLGVIPGAEALAFDPAAGKGAPTLPPIPMTQFAPVEPLAPEQPPGFPPYPAYPSPLQYAAYAGYPAYAPRMLPMPMPAFGHSRSPPYYPERSTPPTRANLDFAGLDFDGVGDWSLDRAAVARYAQAPTPLDQWPILAGGAGGRTPIAQSTPTQLRRLDRLSMSAWAMLRREPGETSLAANGMIGGSQAGARILYRFTPGIAASIRTSAPVGGVTRAAELAAGIRWQPMARIPVAITAERRQSFGRDAGRSDFALFAEGGLYQRPLLAGFDLDSYLQAGVVGVRRRDLFVDGSAAFTRPLWNQLSGGFGVWGGAQPGLYRIDAGPRLSWRIGGKMRVHADYRQRLAGDAAPGSGPVLTLAGDF